MDPQYYDFAGQQSSSFWGGSLLGLLAPLASLGASTPLDNDWHDYIYSSPPRNILCQFKQNNYLNLDPWTAYASDFHPEFNVSNLQWRLTGIGKHQLGLLESD